METNGATMLALRRLQRRQGGGGRWSSRWTENAQGERTTTVTGVDANGQPFTSVTVTDASGRVISKTGNDPFSPPAPSPPPPSPAPSPSPSPAPSPAPQPAPQPAPAPAPSPPSTNPIVTNPIAQPGPDVNGNNGGGESTPPAATPPAVVTTPPANQPGTNNGATTPPPTDGSPPSAQTPATSGNPGHHNDAARDAQAGQQGAVDDLVGSGGLSGGAIAGIVVGVLVLLAAILLLARWYMINRRKRRANARFNIWNKTPTRDTFPSVPFRATPPPAAVSDNENTRMMERRLPTNIVAAPAASYQSPQPHIQVHSVTANAPAASPTNSRFPAVMNTAAIAIKNADLRPRSPSTATTTATAAAATPTPATPATAVAVIPSMFVARAQDNTPLPPPPVAERRYSTDRYRPPVDSVVMTEQAANATTVRSSRVYLTDDAPIVDDVSQPASSLTAADNSAGLGSILGMEHLMHSVQHGGDVSATTLGSAESSSSVGRAAQPVADESPALSTGAAGYLSPAFLSEIPRSPMSGRNAEKNETADGEEADSGRGGNGRKRPPSSVSVKSRQAVPFEAAPMPRAALRVINRLSRDDR